MDTRRKPERRCLAPGCLTTLSSYNMDHLCFAHADEVTRARFERVTSPRIPQANIRYRYTAESDQRREGGLEIARRDSGSRSSPTSR